MDKTEGAPIPHRVMMKGTGAPPYRCVALEGELGASVRCSIHANRSSVCREFPASYEDGVTASDRCDRARQKAGFAPLKPEDWWSSEGEPRPLQPAA